MTEAYTDRRTLLVLKPKLQPIERLCRASYLAFDAGSMLPHALPCSFEILLVCFTAASLLFFKAAVFSVEAFTFR